MNEYKAIVSKMARGGHGIDVHCHDVGLEDPSTVAGDALFQIGQAPDAPADKTKADRLDKFTLFEEGAENYAMSHTSLVSANMQTAPKITEERRCLCHAWSEPWRASS